MGNEINLKNVDFRTFSNLKTKTFNKVFSILKKKHHLSKKSFEHSHEFVKVFWTFIYLFAWSELSEWLI